MASRTPSRGRSGGRSSSSNASGANPALFGGIGVAIVAALIVVFMSSSKGDKAKDKPADPAPAAAAPKAPHVPAPTSLQLGSAKQGKTPGRAAPALTAEMLGKAMALLDEAKTLSNDGVKARTAGDNEGARQKQSAAGDKIEAAKASLKEQAAWQEEADLSDWAQPAEYVSLANLWTQLTTLEKKARMSGGTR